METTASQQNAAIFRTCDVCDVLCVREVEWQSHIKSKRHSKRVASLRSREAKMKAAHQRLVQTLSEHEQRLRVSPTGEDT